MTSPPPRGGRNIGSLVPINKGGAALDLRNLQSLCNSCHNRKSARERR